MVVSLDNFSQEEINLTSMIDLAGKILKDEKKALHFNEIFDRVAELKGFQQNEKENKIAQFYTDINVDGRFLNVGTNMWGLKRWYPVEKVEEELTGGAPKKKKNKKGKKTKKVKEKEKKEEEKAEEETLEVEDKELDITDEEIGEVADDFEEVDDAFDEDLEGFDDSELDDNEDEKFGDPADDDDVQEDEKEKF